MNDRPCYLPLVLGVALVLSAFGGRFLRAAPVGVDARGEAPVSEAVVIAAIMGVAAAVPGTVSAVLAHLAKREAAAAKVEAVRAAEEAAHAAAEAAAVRAELAKRN